MDYKKEIIEIVNSISQEYLLQFFYSLLRAYTSDEDALRAIENMGASQPPI